MDCKQHESRKYARQKVAPPNAKPIAKPPTPPSRTGVIQVVHVRAFGGELSDWDGVKVRVLSRVRNAPANVSTAETQKSGIE